MISSTHDIEPVYAWGSFEITYGIAQNDKGIWEPVSKTCS